MRKVLWVAVAVFAVLAVLRRFGPTLGTRAVNKCRDLMSGAQEERGFEEGRREPTSSMAR